MNKLFKVIRPKHYLQYLGLFFVDILFYTLSNPNKDPSYMVIVGFVLLILSVYLIINLTFALLHLYGLRMKRKKPLSLYLTGMVGLIIALQSVGELSPRDVLELLPIVIIGYAYTDYMRPNHKKTD
jgi:hypothetical protein